MLRSFLVAILTLNICRKAVDRQPNYPLAHFHIGRILANQKTYDEAINHFLMALTPEDESIPAYLYALSATYARAGNLEEALKYGRRARNIAEALGQTELLRSIEKNCRRWKQPRRTEIHC